MDHWSKIVSIVELDPQAFFTIGTYIVQKQKIFIMVSGERLGLWASCLVFQHENSVTLLHMNQISISR